MDLLERARSAFFHEFAEQPAVFARAPGRVELLGNHTDYNGGLVMAAAIDRFTVAAGRRRADRIVRVVSVDLDERDEFTLDGWAGRGEGWARYVRGVVWAVQERFGSLDSGFELALAGNVPRGAGLSSSASLEAAVAWCLLGLGLVAVGDDDVSRMELARALQRAENEYAGVACGLLDQFSSVFGGPDQALMLDCASGAWRRSPMAAEGRAGPSIVVCDSRTSRRLADGMYNRRREECERVVTHFQTLRGPSVSCLRDLKLTDLDEEWQRLDPAGRRRARHVLNENRRVEAGIASLTAGDIAGFGRLMSESHESSRYDFENSSPALDALIDVASQAPGFLGGKLSGAGWAGCTVNLVEPDCAAAFAEAVLSGVVADGGLEPEIHIYRASAGAGVVR